ncbi:hypothetical protein D3C76_1159700 [compost metagenome]
MLYGTQSAHPRRIVPWAFQSLGLLIKNYDVINPFAQKTRRDCQPALASPDDSNVIDMLAARVRLGQHPRVMGKT